MLAAVARTIVAVLFMLAPAGAVASNASFHVGYLFYAVHPSDFQGLRDPKDAPDLLVLALPYYILGIVLESAVLYIKGTGGLPRLNDSISSISSGFIMVLSRCIIQPIPFVGQSLARVASGAGEGGGEEGRG